MGNMLSAAKTSTGNSSFTLIIFVVLLFGIFYFVMIRPQRNRQRRVVAAQDSVMPGQHVRTTAGMYGTVTAVDDGDVVIEVAPGVEVRYLKRAIMDVLSEAPGSDGMGPDGQGPDGMDHDGMDTEPAEPGDEPADEPVAEANTAQDGRAAEK